MLKTHKRAFETQSYTALIVQAYRDADQWVVWADDLDLLPQRFDNRKFTMTEAMEFFIRIGGQSIKPTPHGAPTNEPEQTK